MSLLGTGEWSDFYEPAERADEISVRRPFYPRRHGGASQRHLLDALGVERLDELRRRCELRTPSRRAAAPLFWTLGAQQVGRAAIVGWRDVLAPALADATLDVVLWPFAGRLADLASPGRAVIAETYPTEFYSQLGFDFRGRGKRDADARAAAGRPLLDRAAWTGILVEPRLATAVRDGFRREGDDAFDAAVGLFGMLGVVTGRRPEGEPPVGLGPVEGWILGQAGELPEPLRS